MLLGQPDELLPDLDAVRGDTLGVMPPRNAPRESAGSSLALV